jgi:glycosyltransferase involved in cell wall biosynthesis
MAGTRKIEVVITTYNEEGNIVDCIASAKKLSEKITVIDTESTDKTLSLAHTEGAVNLSFPFSRFVEPVRKFAIKQSDAEWIFILDADERITDELAEEIKQVTIEGNKNSS